MMKPFIRDMAQEHWRPIDARNNRKIVHGRLNQFKEEREVGRFKFHGDIKASSVARDP